MQHTFEGECPKCGSDGAAQVRHGRCFNAYITYCPQCGTKRWYRPTRHFRRRITWATFWLTIIGWLIWHYLVP